MLVIALALSRMSQSLSYPWLHQLIPAWFLKIKYRKLYSKVAGLVSALLLASCQAATPQSQPRPLQVQQDWELQPGQVVAGHKVVGGLGDITVALDGAAAYAPFPGQVDAIAEDGCVVYSSPEVPAYLFRMCGLRRPRFGSIKAGQKIGSGQYLHFAALRRQPDGTWVIVEPALDILEQILTP